MRRMIIAPKGGNRVLTDDKFRQIGQVIFELNLPKIGFLVMKLELKTVYWLKNPLTDEKFRQIAVVKSLCPNPNLGIDLNLPRLR